MGKMNIEVITSFNQNYYDRIGKDCVESWLTHWPIHQKLTCYVEDMTLPTHWRINQVGFEQLGDEYLQFQNLAKTPRQKTFAKKAFAVIHAMHNSTADWVFWIDADVITTQDIDPELFNICLKPEYLCVYMGVRYTSRRDGTTGNWLVPESGIFAVNTKNKKFAQFRQEYSRRYYERDFTGLRKGYDNDVLGATIEATKAKYFDLCGSFTKAYKSPLGHTIFGPYLKHYKAKHSKNQYVQERQ
jgi:hypothetical protein